MRRLFQSSTLIVFLRLVVSGSSQTLLRDRTSLQPNGTDERLGGELINNNCTTGTHKFQEGQQKPVYHVGVHAPAGIETAFREFNLTFEAYLNETVGKRWDPPIEFKMVVTDDPLVDWIDQKVDVDFMYSDTGIYSCIGTEVGGQPLGTTIARLSARGKEYELDVFAGTMMVLSDNNDIKIIADLKDKVIGAQAFSDFAGAQAQFYSMYRNGVNFVVHPKQVIFTQNNEETIRGVLRGDWDVGFVRTGQLERTTIDPNTTEIIDPSRLKVIDPTIHIMGNGDLFPFLHSTPTFPEWPLFAKQNVDRDVLEEVTSAMLAFKDHYEIGMAIEECRKTASNDRELVPCDTQPPIYFDRQARCDTTRELAELALKAGKAGFHAGFRSAKSHFSVRTMQQDAGFIVEDENGNWRCERASTLYDGIFCPEGYYKVPRNDFGKQCDQIGLPCPEGANCFCKPCIRSYEVSLFPMTKGALNYTLKDIRDSSCEKMSLCGRVEQKNEIFFRAYDNRERAQTFVSALVHIGQDVIELNGTLVDSYLYEFSFSSYLVGVAILEVFFDDAQIPESPVRVEIVPRKCQLGLVSNVIGDCECSSDTYEFGSTCMTQSTFAIIISTIILLIALLLGILLLRNRRKKSDQIWHVNEEELVFDHPVEVIGQGAFGVVLLAHYRGTKVAIKRAARTVNRRGLSGTISTSRRGDVSERGQIVAEEDENFEDTEGGNDSTIHHSSASRESSLVDVFGILDGLDQRTIVQRWLPILGGAKTSSTYNNSKILRSLSPHSVAQRSTFEKLCPLFDETGRQRSEFVMEMRLLSRLRHPCITTVMGAVMTGREPMMVMEYMENGSLYDLLRNETVYTGGEIIIQIVRDISQGLRFLHASKPSILHRDLKAKNILIDSRFRAKVADFGLAAKTGKQRGLSGTLFWMAPEYLLQNVYNDACDMYSFGMILYEIYSRKTPYEGEPPHKIIRKICDGRVNYRPTIPETCPDKMREIIRKCWNGKVAIRPGAEDLDMIFTDMTANDAEPLIGEGARLRTEIASGDMLYKVFPKKVADTIKAGQKVEPENHEMVTVFFSDIVKFTDISRKLSPVKVCNMLDRLYLSFDALAKTHEVFKVETIGDAWVGVTNLEGNQNDNHVEQIAKFAIDVVAAAKNILIDEDDPDKGFVHIRVGFHSGHVVSNVIGSLNPRFGLFGDTMNTASRMESNSVIDRIHCSETSANLLKEQAPDFPIYRRGKLKVKGKGYMTTYWVGVSGLLDSNQNDSLTVSVKEAVATRRSLQWYGPSRPLGPDLNNGSSRSRSQGSSFFKSIKKVVPGKRKSKSGHRISDLSTDSKPRISAGGSAPFSLMTLENEQKTSDLQSVEESSEMFVEG